MPNDTELRALFIQKYGEPATTGWGPRQRLRFGYFTPDDVYEAIISKSVDATTTWLDVGCGRDLFPQNPKLAKVLSARCKRLVGLDLSDNLDENPFVHEKVKLAVEDSAPHSQVDMITMRMVAEHVTRPAAVVAALSRMTRPGGKVVILTVNKFSPVTLAAAMSPFGLHHPIKAFLWRSEEKDTFPTAYLMNSRKTLEKHMAAGGFREHSFARLDDCRIFGRFRRLNWLELSVRNLFRRLNLPHPEHCILGIYEKVQ